MSDRKLYKLPFTDTTGRIFGLTSGSQAITVKYLGWTNFLPSRLKAKTTGGNQIVKSLDSDFFDGVTGFDASERLARHLAKKMGWLPEGSYLVGGCLKDVDVFVIVKLEEIA